MLTIDEQMIALDTRLKNASPDDDRAHALVAHILLGQLIEYYNNDQHKPRIQFSIGPVSTQRNDNP